MKSLRPLAVLLLASGCSEVVLERDPPPPAVGIQSPTDGDTLFEGIPIGLVGVISDETYGRDMETLDVLWLVDNEHVCQDAVPDEGGIVNCTHVFPREGEVEVSLSATNPAGKNASQAILVNVLPNDPPNADILLPEASGSYYADYIVEFYGVATDPEDDPERLYVEWESNVDGVLPLDTTAASDGTVAGSLQLTPGAHYITLTVTDTIGRNAQDFVTIFVEPNNNAPTCSIDQPKSGTTWPYGQAIQFEATAYDPDIPLTMLTAEWSSDLDGPLGSSLVPSNGAVTFAESGLSPGTHTIALTVADEVGAACTDTVRLQVGDAPFVTLVAPTSGALFNEGEDVTFEAYVTDTDDNPQVLAFTWDSTIDGVFSTQGANSAGTARFTTRTLSPGTHTLKVEAVDPTGFKGSDGSTFTINGLPTAPTISVTPGTPTSADDLYVNVDKPSLDPEGGAVSYTYAWEMNGTATSYNTSVLPAAATTRGDIWKVEVTANDAYGAGGVGTDTVIIDNAPPVLTLVTLTPDPPNVNDTLTCTPASATDTDGDAITYRYAWYVNGSLVTGSSATKSSGFTTGDTVYCAVTPNDGRVDGSTMLSNAVSVSNTPPEVASASLSPASPTESSTLSCAAGVTTDPDGDTVTLSYDWVVDGVKLGLNQTTLTGTWFDKNQVVTCEVTPDDGAVTGSTVASNPVTIQNSAPAGTTLTLTPDPAYEASTLACVPGSSTDVDGDAVTWSYAWQVNGVTNAVTSSSMTGAWFSKGDLVNCSATPNDGTTNGATLTSGYVAIANTAPTLTSASIAPSSPTSLDTLSVSVAGWGDADGDAAQYIYQWKNGGTSIAGATGSTLTSDNFSRGDVVTVEVTPWDGTDSGAPVTSPGVTVQNSAPSVSGVVVNPTAPTILSTLTCSATTTTDVDLDTVTLTYNWVVAGSSLAYNSTTLTSSHFGTGDSVYCTITPSDGSASGTTVASNTVTIGNSSPSVTSVSLTPTSATELTTFTCSATGADADGDPVTLSYAWEVTGVNIGALGTTLTGTWFNKNDTVTCVVTASDGSSTSAATRSSTVTVSNSAPSASSVSISPSAPYSSNDLTATAAGWADVDGDRENYLWQWYLNGSAIPGATASTLSSTLHRRDDKVYVVATPNDGVASGPAVTSATVTIQNAAPTAPSIAISPTAPQPTDTLSCYVAVPSNDADGDTITYSYSWKENGVPSGIVSSSVSSSYTAHGEVWTCEVVASDGSLTSGTVSASVTVNDTLVPSPPVLNSVDRYRNDDYVSLSGSCEASCSLTLYFSDSGGSWSSSSTCSGSGTLSHTEYITRGVVTSVYATCTDGAGNTSSASNTVQTEACGTWDVYDTSSYAAGYGDVSSFPVDEWAALADNASTTVKVTGNLLASGDSDWYVIDSTDDVAADRSAGIDYYAFDIHMTTGGSTYSFEVYKGAVSAANEQCSTLATGYEDFEYYNYDRGDAADHGIPSDPRGCSSGSASYNDCTDYTTAWYIQVFRDSSSVSSCQHYVLEITNGVW